MYKIPEEITVKYYNELSKEEKDLAHYILSLFKKSDFKRLLKNKVTDGCCTIFKSEKKRF